MRRLAMICLVFTTVGYVFGGEIGDETAYFHPADSLNDIVINEINYNSSVGFDTEDWVEFYNNASSPVDISGWIFKDEEDIHHFVFPLNTILPVDGYLVICYDTSMFRPLFPNVQNVMGNFEFGLSGGGELIRLFDQYATLMDSLTYNDADPWPEEPDGFGPTLELIDPDLPNEDPESWEASAWHGTPGVQNSVTSVERAGGITLSGFSLNPPYPNPFNASATISFHLPASGPVELKVYDVRGREVQSLVTGHLSSGQHEVVWNAAGVGSGVYFVRLTEGGGQLTEVQKVLLVK